MSFYRENKNRMERVMDEIRSHLEDEYLPKEDFWQRIRFIAKCYVSLRLSQIQVQYANF